MKTAIYLAIAAALVVQATPLVAHRDIDVDSLDSVPDPTVDTDTAIHYDLAVDLEDPAERTACQPQPQGKGPRPKKDTPEAFVDFAEFSALAWTAWIPKFYLPTFQNLKASNSARAYMGYTQLDRYDPAACAAKCDAMKGCHSINIYFERSPVVEPGPGCPNPASTTYIKCAFWGGIVSRGNADNFGQWRDDFHVVIAGSNGYVRILPNIGA